MKTQITMTTGSSMRKARRIALLTAADIRLRMAREDQPHGQVLSSTRNLHNAETITVHLVRTTLADQWARLADEVEAIHPQEAILRHKEAVIGLSKSLEECGGLKQHPKATMMDGRMDHMTLDMTPHRHNRSVSRTVDDPTHNANCKQHENVC